MERQSRPVQLAVPPPSSVRFLLFQPRPPSAGFRVKADQLSARCRPVVLAMICRQRQEASLALGGLNFSLVGLSVRHHRQLQSPVVYHSERLRHSPSQQVHQLAPSRSDRFHHWPLRTCSSAEVASVANVPSSQRPPQHTHRSLGSRSRSPWPQLCCRLSPSPAACTLAPCQELQGGRSVQFQVLQSGPRGPRDLRGLMAAAWPRLACLGAACSRRVEALLWLDGGSSERSGGFIECRISCGKVAY